MKYLIPLRIRRKIHMLISKEYYENEKRKVRINKETESEQNLPRYTEAEIGFKNKRIKIVDIASFQFTKKEIFDQQIYQFKADSETPYIIDCGANIGLSIIYFKQLFPGAEIIAFEPDDKVFEALQHNIEVFNFSNVELIKKACWNEETTLKFYSEGADGGRIAKDFDVNNIIEVPTTRLRKFLNKRVDFLKIDIEGAEVRVLADCEDLLNNVDNLFVEYHSYIGVEQSLDILLAILNRSGFRYFIQQHGIVSLNPFIKIENQNNMDILLNISAHRNF